MRIEKNDLSSQSLMYFLRFSTSDCFSRKTSKRSSSGHSRPISHGEHSMHSSRKPSYYSSKPSRQKDDGIVGGHAVDQIAQDVTAELIFAPVYFYTDSK